MFTQFFEDLWNTLFGTQTFYGVNMGFWAGMFTCIVLVVIQNIVFWRCFKPYHIQHINQPE